MIARLERMVSQQTGWRYIRRLGVHRQQMTILTIFETMRIKQTLLVMRQNISSQRSKVERHV